MLLSANMIRLHDTYGIKNMFDILAKAGFEGIDFNNDVAEYCTTEHDAEFYRELGEYAKSRGIAICQAHAPFPSSYKDDEEKSAKRFEEIVQGIKNAAYLGAPMIVVHPCTHLDYSLEGNPEILFDYNLNFYKKLIPVARECGIKIASENIGMPVIVRLEALMGSAGAMVHTAVKVIYETLNELDTADIKLDGINKLLDYPEYSDTKKLRNLLGVLEEKDKLLDVISSHTTNDEGINVYIGTENDSDAMSNTTLIFKNVNVGGKRVAVGVIGPKRMNYSKVIGMINQLASGIDRIFSEEERMLTDGKKGIF